MVIDSEVSEQISNDRIERTRELLKENSVNAELAISKEGNILQGVLKQAKQADLVLMGGRSGDFLELLLGKSLAQEITERTTCPVLWLKEYEERPSFWQALIKPLKKEI
jgi:nucleotide-binding universal stress UspA family protein